MARRMRICMCSSLSRSSGRHSSSFSLMPSSMFIIGKRAAIADRGLRRSHVCEP
jgi:hypothetical protein